MTGCSTTETPRKDVANDVPKTSKRDKDASCFRQRKEIISVEAELFIGKGLLKTNRTRRNGRTAIQQPVPMTSPSFAPRSPRPLSDRRRSTRHWLDVPFENGVDAPEIKLLTIVSDDATNSHLLSDGHYPKPSYTLRQIQTDDISRSNNPTRPVFDEVLRASI